MNTSKQVNVMIALLFLVVAGFGLYFAWDQNVRAGDASEKQVEKNAERGAFLFARNCRICHGVTGQGVVENPNLPGAPLNLPDNRPPDPSKLRAIQARFTDTVVCGRVGTLMPPWHIDQGGALNDFQIEQLVALITGATSDLIIADPGPDGEFGTEDDGITPNAISEKAWEKIQEFALHDDTLGKFLTRDVSANDRTLTLNDVKGVAVDSFLRIEDEVVQVKEVPPATELAAAIFVGREGVDVIQVKDASHFEVGMVIAIDKEHLRIISISDNSMTVEQGVEGTEPEYHRPNASVAHVSPEIAVERGAFGTTAAPHAADSEVFAGPIPPPTGPVTGADSFVCGQKAAAPVVTGPPAPTPSAGQPQRPATAQPVVGEPEPVTGNVLEVEAQDNRFAKNNFRVPVGQAITIRLTNVGQNLHNLRIASPDGQWNTADDVAVPTDGGFLSNGQTAEGSFTLAQEATLVFRCDVHPTQMWGQITVASQ